MAKNPLTPYAIQAFESPYTGELFKAADEEKFRKHLGTHKRRQTQADTLRKTQASISDYWAEVRTKAQNINDVIQAINASGTMATELAKWSHDSIFYPKFKISTQPLVPLFPPKLEYYGITHEAPMGEPTNWGGQDPSQTQNFFAHVYPYCLPYPWQNSKNYTGIVPGSRVFILFAKDWDFVGRDVISAYLYQRDFPQPHKHPYNDKLKTFDTSKIKPQWNFFIQELNDLFMKHLGVARTTALEWKKLGLLPATQDEFQTHLIQRSLPCLELPTHLLDTDLSLPE